MADNAADRKGIRRLEKAAKIAEGQRRDTTTQIMSTAPGRTWLWDILASCSIFSTTHVPADPLASAYQEGRRSVGLSLLSDIMAYCPDQFIQAMREHNERRIAAAAAAPDSRTDTDPLAERSGSAESDGGDSGAEPDRSAAPSAEGPGWNPGADIYAPNGSGTP